MANTGTLPSHSVSTVVFLVLKTVTIAAVRV